MSQQHLGLWWFHKRKKMENNHITVAISFCELIRSTLGPRGMNKMVVNEGKGEIILTNDGATIIQNVKGGNPIVDLFMNLAVSQENAIGDGTTTSVIIAGQLLQNAITLIDKGIHPTTIITGYNLAKVRSLKYLDEHREPGDREKIIKTAFGTKIAPDIINHLCSILLNVKNFENLKLYKIPNSDTLDSEVINGFVFPGFTINERMKSQVTGKIAVLDFPSNMELDKIQVTNADELEKITQKAKQMKRQIVDELVKNKIDCVFYTDTNPEFESYLTDKEITGVVVFQRENIDGICKALNLRVCSCIEDVESHFGEGNVKYVKQTAGNSGHIYINSDKSEIETLVLNGPTDQTLSEIERATLDVISLLKHETDCVIGAGAIEIDIALDLRNFANEIGGKEQLAIEKFAESIESIPMIIAENAGLDAMEILTNLKTIHKNNKDMGVDIIQGISDARERGIIEPVLVKIYAINSATNVATLILKLDRILTGEEEKK